MATLATVAFTCASIFPWLLPRNNYVFSWSKPPSWPQVMVVHCRVNMSMAPHVTSCSIACTVMWRWNLCPVSRGFLIQMIYSTQALSFGRNPWMPIFADRTQHLKWPLTVLHLPQTTEILLMPSTGVLGSENVELTNGIPADLCVRLSLPHVKKKTPHVVGHVHYRTCSTVVWSPIVGLRQKSTRH